jgi:hypothetical protein
MYILHSVCGAPAALDQFVISVNGAACHGFIGLFLEFAFST